MAENENLDAASICTLANIRLSVVKLLLEKGVNVAIEKPFAVSIEEAKEMLDLKKYGVKLTVIHNWLFSHIMKRTMKYLRSGWVGEIVSVEISMLHTKNDPMTSDPTHWCHKIPAGRFGENFSHSIYYCPGNSRRCRSQIHTWLKAGRLPIDANRQATCSARR